MKLHKLLYYCQGHHVATLGVPLFTESLSAWDIGPVVGSLWRSEKEEGPATRHECSHRVAVDRGVHRTAKGDGDDEVVLDALEVAEWLQGADAHRDAPLRADHPDELAAGPRISGRGSGSVLGVRRQTGFENLWFGVAPETDNGDGRVVACSYWIVESTHTVRCNSFAPLAPPF